MLLIFEASIEVSDSIEEPQWCNFVLMQVGMHIAQYQPVWVLWLLCCDRLHKHKHSAPVHPYRGQHALLGWKFIWFEWNQFDLIQGHSCRAHPETTAKAPQMHSLDMADYLGPVLGDVYKEANLKQLYPWQVNQPRIANVSICLLFDCTAYSGQSIHKFLSYDWLSSGMTWCIWNQTSISHTPIGLSGL